MVRANDVASDLQKTNLCTPPTVVSTLYDDKWAGYEELVIKEGEKVISQHRCNTEAMTTGYVADLVTAGRSLGLRGLER